MSLPADQLADWLQRHLGQKLVAYALGLTDPKMVGRYRTGAVKPRDMVLWRMQSLWQAAQLIHDRHGPDTTRSWLMGINGHLDGRAPAQVLRNATDIEQFGEVVLASRAFVNGEYA
ncbi:MAG: hypothetical protein M0P31_18235 [Solirubrobacteraceae bacterium]|nr:hypothetical protein [Solirubrobacteraceae bacterium]